MSPHAVLLVEGQDDKHVLSSLLFAHDLDSAFQIKDKNGLSNLLLTLPTELRASDLTHIGVIIDANGSMINRWEQLTSVLTKAGFSPPREPHRAGTILSAPGKPTVGIWIMPDNHLDGAIEDFAALLVPLGDTLMPRAVAAVEQIPAAERPFSSSHQTKAVMHTWLAWQKEPGARMGSALARKYLQSDSQAATALILWLKNLQDLTP